MSWALLSVEDMRINCKLTENSSSGYKNRNSQCSVAIFFVTSHNGFGNCANNNPLI
jgi:hypothetical protein